MLIATYLLAGLLFAQEPAPTEPQADAPPALSEIDRLRVENHALKVRLAQLETQVRTEVLREERERLDAAVRATYPGWRWDWQTGTLVAVPTGGDKEP